MNKIDSENCVDYARTRSEQESEKSVFFIVERDKWRLLYLLLLATTYRTSIYRSRYLRIAKMSHLLAEKRNIKKLTRLDKQDTHKHPIDGVSHELE